ncbi:MAG TPA: glycosyltransferase family 4 protein [Ktedonobacterales bacterium]
MAVPSVLLINACGSVGGDMAMMLLGLSHLDENAFEVFAISIPRGKVYERLQTIPSIKKVIPMELGGEELRPSNRQGKRFRLSELSRAILQITRFVRREHIDLIYAVDRGIAPHIAQVVSRLTKRPFVLSAHFTHYADHSRTNRAVVRQARLIHGPSDHLLAFYRPYVAHPERLVKTPNALEIAHYDPALSGASLRQELGIEAEAPMVLLAGRLSPFKGQDTLIEAATHLLKERPDTHFVLAGSDSLEGRFTHGPQATSFKAVLEELIARHHIEQHVHLVGNYPNAVDRYPNLQTLFAAATVCTMPSWGESFGLVALEAMAMGKPVVASRAGGVPEFISDGETGLLVPPRDPQSLAHALLELINNPERARRMGLKARQQVEAGFTADLYGKRVTQVLCSALAQEMPASADVMAGR